MSREVLLTLLGTLLIVNVGVLISIGLLSRRGRLGRTSGSSSVSVEGVQGATVVDATDIGTVAYAEQPDVEAAVASVTQPTRVMVATASGAAPAPAPASAPTAVMLAEPSASTDDAVTTKLPEREREDALIAGNGHLRHQTGTEAESEDAAAATAEPATAEPATAEPASVEPATVAASRNGWPTTAGGKRRRSRRFVLPPLEEDSDRSARAIEAFLGEALVSPPLAHPERLQRRRHRARRAPGARTSRTSLVVELIGYRELAVAAGEDQAVRLAGALAEALWRSARIGDEVRELEPGRIQLVLDCDPTGAEAFAARARAIVAPWLSASAVPLQIEVETDSSAASTGGSAAG